MSRRIKMNGSAICSHSIIYGFKCICVFNVIILYMRLLVDQNLFLIILTVVVVVVALPLTLCHFVMRIDLMKRNNLFLLEPRICGFIQSNKAPFPHFDRIKNYYECFRSRRFRAIVVVVVVACTLLFYQFVNLINIVPIDLSFSFQRLHSKMICWYVCAMYILYMCVLCARMAKTNVFIKC